MPTYINHLKNNLLFEFNHHIQIKGLDNFRKTLEKIFFAQVTFRQYALQNSGRTNLVVEMDCNLSLVETLYYFNKGTWGSFKSIQSSFNHEMNTLTQLNEFTVDIDELSINFQDTSIIIKKDQDQNIPVQFEKILDEIGNHYVHFTKGLTEIPYEIYISVFEETDGFNGSPVVDAIESTKGNSFFDFWGIYYDSDEDAAIYDLKNLTIVSGELYLLNQ